MSGDLHEMDLGNTRRVGLDREDLLERVPAVALPPERLVSDHLLNLPADGAPVNYFALVLQHGAVRHVVEAERRRAVTGAVGWGTTIVMIDSYYDPLDVAEPAVNAHEALL